MPNFRIDNGKIGAERVYHTPTGYQGVANHPGNKKGYAERVMFFARHVVMENGHPCTEIGFSGLEDAEKPATLKEIRAGLRARGLTEVLCLTEAPECNRSFSEHVPMESDSVAVRINIGKDGIALVMDVLGKMLYEAAREFIQEQEQVPDVLYHSIMSTMGPELSRGPGGEDGARKRARKMAHELEFGFHVHSAKRNRAAND